MEFTKFKFHFPIQMRWNDLDALGHVNNAIFITYFEVARGHYMVKACPDWNWTKDMFLIANVQINYQKELLLTAENPKVHIRTQSLGTKSFVLEYIITSEKDGERIIHAFGSTTQIMFDMQSRKTIEIPEHFRKALKEFDEID